MASSTHCTACLRTLRYQLRQPRQVRSTSAKAPRLQTPTTLLQSYMHSRLFSNYLPLSAAQASPQKATPSTPSQAQNSDPPSKNIKTYTSTPAHTIAAEVRKRASSVTETYIAYGVCEKLVKECARQADYTIPQAQEKGVEIPKTKDGEDLGVGTGYWYDSKSLFFFRARNRSSKLQRETDPYPFYPALGLTPTFNTWAQVTFLHMYLLTVRMRCFPPAHAPSWHQHLLDHFFYTAEDRMLTAHNVHARTIRNKYLKDLFVQWRGLLAGYDEGLVKGDAVLATAVWRNVFRADEEVDLRRLGEVMSYMRGVLRGLEEMPDEGVAGGEVVFGDPGSEREGVLRMSRGLDEGLKDVVAEGTGEQVRKGA